MNKFFAIATVVFLGFASFGCSSAPKRETVKLEDRPSAAVQKNTDVGVPANVPRLSEMSERISDNESLLPDNSRLITSFDEYGNKTETRVFPKASDLPSVTTRTDSDGNVQVALNSNNGEMRSVADDQRRRALSASAADTGNRLEPQESVTRPPEQHQPTLDVRSIQLPVVIKVGTR
jgi:hypothetical protein